MIPPSFDYIAPKTLSEAVAALGENENSRILAGGQSLIPLMRFRLAGPTVPVDLNRVEGLSYIEEKDGWLKIGAMTRQSTVEHSELVSEKYSLLADTVKILSDPVVRNLGTVGGNIANADPVNDQPATMLAYGAEVVAVGSTGERIIPMTSFYLDLYQSALARDEILTEVRVPAPRPRSGGSLQLPIIHAAPQEALDPVCGMTVEIDTARFSSEYAGTTYYFCAAGCKRSFDKDPQKYIQPESSQL